MKKNITTTMEAPVNVNTVAAPAPTTEEEKVITFAIACRNLYLTGRKKPLNKETLQRCDVSRDAHMLKVYAVYDAVCAVSNASKVNADGSPVNVDKTLIDAFFTAWRVLLNGLGKDERGKHYVASPYDLPFFLSLVRNLKTDKKPRAIDKNDGSAPTTEAPAPAPLKWGYNAPDAFRFNVEWLLGARVENVAINGKGEAVTADKKRAAIYKRMEAEAKKADKKGATEAAARYRAEAEADKAATGYDKRNPAPTEEKPAEVPASDEKKPA